jgi:hypothetical protein
MFLRLRKKKKYEFFASLKSLKKGVGSVVGSGTVSRRYGTKMSWIHNTVKRGLGSLLGDLTQDQCSGIRDVLLPIRIPDPYHGLRIRIRTLLLFSVAFKIAIKNLDYFWVCDT